MNRVAAVSPGPATGAAGPAPLQRSIVLVGLMGAGKTSVGRRLAKALSTAFADADEEIAQAAGMSIPDIFELYGETAFRDLERRVVARLLDQPPMVIALGGGAFVDPAIRARVAARGVSIWLRADLDTLVVRTQRKRDQRPLLRQGDSRAILRQLMEQRYPIYAEAQHVIETTEDPAEQVVDRILAIPGLAGVPPP